MRVFGGGHLVGAQGKYPSLSTCDEIMPETLIMIIRKDKSEKEKWENIHDSINRRWKREFIKFDPPNSGNLGKVFLAM